MNALIGENWQTFQKFLPLHFPPAFTKGLKGAIFGLHKNRGGGATGSLPMGSLLILFVMMLSLEPKFLFSQLCGTHVNAWGDALSSS